MYPVAIDEGPTVLVAKTLGTINDESKTVPSTSMASTVSVTQPCRLNNILASEPALKNECE
jgi:hypothetical protein